LILQFQLKHFLTVFLEGEIIVRFKKIFNLWTTELNVLPGSHSFSLPYDLNNGPLKAYTTQQTTKFIHHFRSIAAVYNQ